MLSVRRGFLASNLSPKTAATQTPALPDMTGQPDNFRAAITLEPPRRHVPAFVRNLLNSDKATVTRSGHINSRWHVKHIIELASGILPNSSHSAVEYLAFLRRKKAA